MTADAPHATNNAARSACCTGDEMAKSSDCSDSGGANSNWSNDSRRIRPLSSPDEGSIDLFPAARETDFKPTERLSFTGNIRQLQPMVAHSTVSSSEC